MKFYVLGTLNTQSDGAGGSVQIPSIASPVLSGKDMKKYVAANSPLSVDMHLFEMNEFSFTVAKKTVNVDVDDLTIGAPI